MSGDDAIIGNDDGSIGGDGVTPGDSTCVRDCNGKQCGPDSCGGVCGACPDGLTCGPTYQCQTGPCVPDCAGRECGPDGCNGNCGSCTQGAICDTASGQCDEACEADCSGLECGSDGCGGSCGSCPAGTHQCDAGTCESTCQPSCAGKACGDNGCGGSCGSCGSGTACQSGQCVSTTQIDCLQLYEECFPEGMTTKLLLALATGALLLLVACGGDDGGQGQTSSTRCDPGDTKACACSATSSGTKVCGDDKHWESCQCGTVQPDVVEPGDVVDPGDVANPGDVADDTVTTCTPTCQGKACGPDGCGGSCGSCPQGEACQPDYTCEPGTCTPDCEGRECGSDGCGGSCGSCDKGQTCDYVGQCQGGGCTCPDVQCGLDGCGGTCGACATGSYCVVGAGYCGTGGGCPEMLACARACLDNATDVVTCVFDLCDAAAADPTYTALLLCVQQVCSSSFDSECAYDALEGTCASEYAVCEGGCAPSCAGKQCGSDGCGGSPTRAAARAP